MLPSQDRAQPHTLAPSRTLTKNVRNPVLFTTHPSFTCTNCLHEFGETLVGNYLDRDALKNILHHKDSPNHSATSQRICRNCQHAFKRGHARTYEAEAQRRRMLKDRLGSSDELAPSIDPGAQLDSEPRQKDFDIGRNMETDDTMASSVKEQMKNVGVFDTIATKEVFAEENEDEEEEKTEIEEDDGHDSNESEDEAYSTTAVKDFPIEKPFKVSARSEKSAPEVLFKEPFLRVVQPRRPPSPQYAFPSPLEIMGFSGLQSLYCLGQLVRNDAFLKAYQAHFLPTSQRMGTEIDHLIVKSSKRIVVPDNTYYQDTKPVSDNSTTFTAPRAVLYTEGPVLPLPPLPPPVHPATTSTSSLIGTSTHDPPLQQPLLASPFYDGIPWGEPPPGHAFLYTRRRGAARWMRHPAERGRHEHWAFIRDVTYCDDPKDDEDEDSDTHGARSDRSEASVGVRSSSYGWEQIWGDPLDLSTVGIWVRKKVRGPMEETE